MVKLNVALTLVLALYLPEPGYSTLWPCESDSDCIADRSNCSLDIGQCECENFELVFSRNFTTCLKTSLYGEACEESVQCNLMPSGADCKAGVCDCADGHTFVRGQCRKLRSLEEACETDLDCYFGYDRESVACQDKVCACANGYYRRNGNICRRKSMEINDACVVDTDCEGIGSNVKCSNLLCQYDDNDGSEARNVVKRLDSKDDESLRSELTISQISKSTSSETIRESLKSVQVNGRAISTEQTDTETETEPEPEPSRKSREIAVQTSLDAFELRPLNRDSYTHRNSPLVRNVGTVTTSNSTSSSTRYTSYDRRRQQSTQRQDDEDKTVSTLSNTDDDGDEKKYGSSCTDNGKACSGLSHSICSNSICLCRQGYYHKNGKCFAELGEIAESADECEHTFDEVTKKCICQKNFFYERSLRACRKPIRFDLSCTSNSQCSPFGAAYCKSDIPRRCTCEEYAEYDALRQMCIYKTGLGAQCETNDGCPIEHSICLNRYCVCKANFFEKDGACLPGLGADCQTHTDCVKENSMCGAYTGREDEKDKTCQCRKGFVHFKDECLKEADELEDVCIETEQCKPLLASCIDKKCSCTAEQHFKFGRCEEKKGIGEACSRAGECFIEKDPETIECRNSVCQCKIGYQSDAEQKTCIRVMPSKKNSSGRPSALKIITFLLIGSAFLITSAAIKQAYY